MSTDNEKLAAFVNPDSPEICGMKLRPFSAGSMVMLQLVENPLLANDGFEREKANPVFQNGGEHELAPGDWIAIEEWRTAKTEAEKGLSFECLSANAKVFAQKSQEIPYILFHIASFIFIHVASVREVRRASKNNENYRDAVLTFTESLSVKALIEAAPIIKAMIEAAMVGQDYRVDGGDSPPNPLGQPGPLPT